MGSCWVKINFRVSNEAEHVYKNFRRPEQRGKTTPQQQQNDIEKERELEKRVGLGARLKNSKGPILTF
jgi:hypothetical protein